MCTFIADDVQNNFLVGRQWSVAQEGCQGEQIFMHLPLPVQGIVQADAMLELHAAEMSFCITCDLLLGVL